MSTTSTSTSTGNGTATRPKAGKGESAVGSGIRWADQRLGVAKGGGKAMLDKIFPDHWSFLLGEIALYSFVVLLATGVFLSLYFDASGREIVYNGAYAPFRGVRMSAAYASSIDLSFGVRCGLLMRQMHHWAADVFVGSMAIHMVRIFFTGAFRKPRELNWIVGVTLLTLAIVNGFLGYSLPDDLVSGTGIRIAYSIILSIPLVGTYLATLLFGGTFPGTGTIIGRFYLIHILLVPAIIGLLVAVHLGLLVRQKHTQFPGKGRTEDNVVGSPMYPTFIAKTTGFLFMVTGILWALGGLIQINPIWQFGPYGGEKQFTGADISYAVQPDWYMGWLDGALRIMPSWEFAGFGHTIPLEIFLPAVLFPGLTFGLFYAWPFLEAKLTGDRDFHNLLDRPRDKPRRTAVGAAFLAFYFMLFCASSTDVLANFFHVSLNLVLWSFRFTVIVVPLIVGGMTYRICLDMSGVQGIGKRKRANIVTRSAEGAYATTVSEPRPGDGHHELDPIAVPTYIDLGDDEDPEPGVRRIARRS